MGYFEEVADSFYDADEGGLGGYVYDFWLVCAGVRGWDWWVVDGAGSDFAS